MESTIRYKVVNKKKRLLCDYNLNCKNLAFKEVYPHHGKGKEDSGWSYLCYKHFKEEQKKLKGKLSYCNVD